MKRRGVKKRKSKEWIPEFQGTLSFIFLKHLKEVSVDFHTGDVDMGSEITRMEWDGLMNFLRRSKNKKSLPAGNEGYSGYDIRSGLIDFYSSKEKLKRIEPLRIQNLAKWKKSKKYIEKTAKDTKKAGLAERIYLRYEKFSIMFKRKTFIKVRNGCLGLKYFIKDKRFSVASLKFR